MSIMATSCGLLPESPNVEHGRVSSRSASLLVLAAAALWGTTGTAQAFGHAGDPVAVGAGRLVVGGAALVVIALAGRRGVWLRRCLRRPLLGWTAAAATATVIYQSAFFSAVATTGVATGTVVALATAPVATGLCGAVIFRERLTRWWATATAFAVVGCVVLVLSAGSSTGRISVLGVGLAVVAGGCYGAYTTCAKVLLERGVPAVPAMGASLGLGAIALGPVLALHTNVFAAPRALLMVAWLGLVTTAAAYVLFARGLRQLPAATVGTLSLAEPLTAAALGLLVLGERPGPAAAVGGASLLAGLALATRRPIQVASSQRFLDTAETLEVRT
jgi:DME family drug/metabolite transporter